MFKSNRFQPIRSAQPLRKIASFDVETTGKTNEFYQVSLVSDFEKRIFYSKDEFIEHIKKNYKSYWIFATNLQFDFFSIFRDRLRKEIHKPIFRGSQLIAVKLYTTNNNNNKVQTALTFLDSMNYAPFSVETLGKLMNLPKLTKPSFLGKAPKNETEKEILDDYNLQDSFITYKFIVWFQKEVLSLGGSLQTTISKISLDLFRRKYFNSIWLCSKDYVDDFVREAYYGGRTEVFKRGLIKDVNYYDINSLYPSMMLKELPIPDSYKFIKISSIETIKNYEGVSKVLIYCPHNVIPLLPHKFNGKLLFPNGLIRGSWCHNELRKALEIGYKIIEFDTALIFERTEKIFYNFITDLYKKRMEFKESNNSAEIIIKTIMNSSYGKFAQRTDLEKWLHVDNLPKDFDLKDMININEEAYIRVKGKEEFKPSFIFPILSAYITAYGRLKLYESINENTIYLDTDSVFTSENIQTSKKLGEFKLEKVIKSGIIVKPKFYMCDDDFKIKGITKIRPQEFFDLVTGNRKRVVRTKFMKYREALKRNLMVNQKIQVAKTTGLEDNKRVWKLKFNPKELQNSKPIFLNELIISPKEPLKTSISIE